MAGDRRNVVRASRGATASRIVPIAAPMHARGSKAGCLCSGSAYSIAFGPSAGQKVLTLQAAMPRETDFKQTLCADIDGFSLHTAVHCGAEPGREAARAGCPAPGEERELCERAACKAVAARVHAAAGGAGATPTPAPDPFGVRTASLREVSGPPLRFHGVLAPNAKLRALVVPLEPEPPEPPDPAAPLPDYEAHCAHHRSLWLSWDRLLKRVFEIDLEHCTSCGGELKIIAAILRGEPGHKRS